jgi:hypothetical protein
MRESCRLTRFAKNNVAVLTDSASNGCQGNRRSAGFFIVRAPRLAYPRLDDCERPVRKSIPRRS